MPSSIERGTRSSFIAGGRDHIVQATEEYLLFRLGEEMFAIEVVSVREIVDFKSLTRVPEAPSCMNGLLNLRGRVVPVVNLRVKFDMSVVERTIDTRVVIVEVEHDGEQVVLGMLVDAVMTVFDLTKADMSQAPELGTGIDHSFIKGIGKRGEDFVILLDHQKLLSYGELVVC